MKVSMDKLWVILNKFRGGHKWNMQISGRGTSFQNGYPTVYGIALIVANEHTDSGIFLLLKVKYIFTVRQHILHVESHKLGVREFWGQRRQRILGTWAVAHLFVRPSVTRRHSRPYQNYPPKYDRVVFTAG